MKTISYTYEQITGIVNNLNRLQVTGLEQARTLTMVGVLLDEGVQSGETDGGTSGDAEDRSRTPGGAEKAGGTDGTAGGTDKAAGGTDGTAGGTDKAAGGTDGQPVEP